MVCDSAPGCNDTRCSYGEQWCMSCQPGYVQDKTVMPWRCVPDLGASAARSRAACLASPRRDGPARGCAG